jgi:hypothetical protein
MAQHLTLPKMNMHVQWRLEVNFHLIYPLFQIMGSVEQVEAGTGCDAFFVFHYGLSIYILSAEKGKRFYGFFSARANIHQ